MIFKKKLGPLGLEMFTLRFHPMPDHTSYLWKHLSQSQQNVSRNEETWVIVPKVKMNLQRTGHQTQEHPQPMGCVHVVMRHKRDPNMI